MDLSDIVNLSFFSAEDIVESLKSALEANLSDQKKCKLILNNVSERLINLSFEEKFKELSLINDKINKSKDSNEIEEEINLLIIEIKDLLSYIQLRGGIIDNADIPVDFLHAIDIQLRLLHLIFSNKYRHKFEHLVHISHENFANLMNMNYHNFRQPEVLIQDLKNFIDFDEHGKFNEMLVRDLAEYYLDLQKYHFTNNLKIKNLSAAINLMFSHNFDFSESIKKLDNNNKHKYGLLSEHSSKHPFFKEEAERCAELTENESILIDARQRFPRNSTIQKRFWAKLAEITSLWITKFISQEKNDMNTAHHFFSIYKNMISNIEKDNIKKLYEIIRNSELEEPIRMSLGRSTDIERSEIVEEIRKIVDFN